MNFEDQRSEVRERVKKLFDENFIKLIRHARELNEDKKIYGDIYFHPIEGLKKIKIKSIDSNSKTPLCEVNSRPQRDWKERQFEAFLIREAKKDGWKLSIEDKKYRFLASQFTFQSPPGKRQTKHIDILGYIDNDLLILELKRDSMSVDDAEKQLREYIDMMISLYEKESAGFIKAFRDEEFGGLDIVKGIHGYIAYPEASFNSDSEKQNPLNPVYKYCGYFKVNNSRNQVCQNY